jgi:hypothetical protein
VFRILERLKATRKLTRTQKTIRNSAALMPDHDEEEKKLPVMSLSFCAQDAHMGDDGRITAGWRRSGIVFTDVRKII